MALKHMNERSKVLVLAGLALGVLALAGGVSGATNVSSCIDIVSPGLYELNTSITDATFAQKCINISSSDVILDGKGFTVDGGANPELNSYGVYVYGWPTIFSNITVKNIVVTNWDAGIYYFTIDGGLIENNTAFGNLNSGIHLESYTNSTVVKRNNATGQPKGIWVDSFCSNNTITNNSLSGNTNNGVYLGSSSGNTIQYNTANFIVGVGGADSGISLSSSHNNTVTNNIAGSNDEYGIYLSGSENNTITGNNLTNNGFTGMYLSATSRNNTMDGNTIISSGSYGIYIDSSGSGNTLTGNTVAGSGSYGIYLDSALNNLLYDNLFNNTVNLGWFGGPLANFWNTTKTPGTNIVGGPFLGGNYWAHPNGTGFSETCADANSDGICDTNYTLAAGNVDYLPLTTRATVVSPSSITNCTTITSPGTYTLQNDILNSPTNFACIEITSSDVVFDGQGYTVDGTGSFSYGIYAHGSFGSPITNVTVKNVTVTDWWHGIYYSYVDNSTGSIRDNTVTSNSYGIYLAYSNNNTVANNNVSYNNGSFSGYGIYISYSNNTNVTGNIADSNKYDGIYLFSSSYNSIENNDAKNNGDSGIMLEAPCACSYNNITGNNASNNGFAGIQLYDEDNSLIRDNYVMYNKYGIYIFESRFVFPGPVNNRIYNNYVAGNTIANAFDNSRGLNYWNRPKTLGTNIIGGPYLGGNYWGDYIGADTNGDGIGDAFLPYNSKGNIASGGDSLPLTNRSGDSNPPSVNSFTLSRNRVFVGDNVTVTANVTDDTNLTFVNLQIIHIKPLTNATAPLVFSKKFAMTNIGGDIYQLNLTLPVYGLHILRILAYDTSANLNNTEERILIVDKFDPLTGNFTGGFRRLINTSDGDAVFDIFTRENMTNVPINLTRARRMFKGKKPLNRTYGLGANHHSMEKFIQIDVPPYFLNNITWVLMKVRYNVSDLDRTGDGDANDPEDLKPTALRFYWYNTTNDSWVKLEKGVNLTAGGGPYVYDAGVDTANRYVWANLSHFSIYGLGASVYGGGASVYGGGGGIAPQVVPRTGIVRITRAMYVSLVRQFNYFDRRFYDAATELWGVLGALKSYWAPIEYADSLNPITHPHDIETIEGDVYTLTAEQVLGAYDEGADTVLIARGDLGVDSMAATSYAQARHMPILLVEPTSIPESTADALQRLGTKSVIIAGGHEAVSEELVPFLPNATRIWGADRYWTAKRLAEELMKDVNVDTVVVTDGLDPEGTAVMVASYYDAPIVYVKGDEVPEPTRDFLQAHRFKKVILVEVSDPVAEEIKRLV